MDSKTAWASALLLAFLVSGARAQETTAPVLMEKPVALTDQSLVADSSGVVTLAARLKTTALSGTPESPVQNIRLVIENRSGSSYPFVSGHVSFYDSQGIRCGEALFKLDALAAGETAETDTPGIRITRAPATWRISANALLTVVREPSTPDASHPETNSSSSRKTRGEARALPPLSIVINGETHPIQADNPIKIKMCDKELTITLVRSP
jgi:hypothetical protein